MGWEIRANLGPHVRGGVDARGWLWEITRGAQVGHVVVEISGSAWSSDPLRLPEDTRHALETEDVESICAHVSTNTLEHCGWPFVPAEMKGVLAAQMSVRYGLAAVWPVDDSKLRSLTLLVVVAAVDSVLFLVLARVLRITEVTGVLQLVTARLGRGRAA